MCACSDPPGVLSADDRILYEEKDVQVCLPQYYVVLLVAKACIYFVFLTAHYLQCVVKVIF